MRFKIHRTVGSAGFAACMQGVVATRVLDPGLRVPPRYLVWLRYPSQVTQPPRRVAVPLSDNALL